jgi:hypothetical protein
MGTCVHIGMLLITHEFGDEFVQRCFEFTLMTFVSWKFMLAKTMEDLHVLEAGKANPSPVAWGSSHRA